VKKEQTQIPVIINIILILIFLAAIGIATVRFAPEITEIAKNHDKFRELLVSYWPLSILIFILIQMLQVVIAAIPGEVLQIAGGYIYGTVLGTAYSFTGIFLGTILTFYISRILGFSLVRSFFSRKNIEKFDFLINSQKSEIAMFILFLLPGIPKDLLSYIAGLTPIKPSKFFIISMLGRLPALIISSYLGENLQKGTYTPVIIVSAVVCILFTIGIFMKDKIINRIRSITHR
jgi:uncharacterized membrane protein YdjX (TVP38/TMEM64 family)